jgi:hypothetical protein
MPGNAKQCRSNAERYLRLAGRAKRVERQQNFAALAETWKKLAAELEADQALLHALSELKFDEHVYTVPEALNLRAA